MKKIYHKLGLWIFVIFVLIDLNCYGFSRRMPYLFNKKDVLIQFSILFPLMLALFTYFLYFHKWKISGRTSFRMRFTKKELANPYIKAKYFFLSSVGVVFFSAGLSWISWGIVACGANLYSVNIVNTNYIVSYLKVFSRGVDLGLLDNTTHIEYSLYQHGYYITVDIPWKIGDIVCAKGRTSALGTIVDELKAGSCEN